MRVVLAVLVVCGVACGGGVPPRCEVARAIRDGARTVEQAAEIAERYACGEEETGEE